jgi:hypothetical protein
MTYGVLCSLNVIIQAVQGLDLDHGGLGAGVSIARGCSTTCVNAAFGVFGSSGNGIIAPSKERI